MSHAAYMPGNRVNSQFLMVVVWLPTFPFDDNLCFRCPNGSCEPILDIYVSIFFQWYRKFFKPMGFDPCNYALKIRESIWTFIPTMGVHLGVWGFISLHSLHSLHSWEHVMWLPGLSLGPQPCNPLALVASPRLGLRHRKSQKKEKKRFENLKREFF